MQSSARTDVPVHSENADCMQMGRDIVLSNQTFLSLPPTTGQPRALSPIALWLILPLTASAAH